MRKEFGAWCQDDSGVKQGDPLSPILFNLVIEELLGKKERRKEGNVVCDFTENFTIDDIPVKPTDYDSYFKYLGIKFNLPRKDLTE